MPSLLHQVIQLSTSQPINLLLLQQLRRATITICCLLVVHYQAIAPAPHVLSVLPSSLDLIIMLPTTRYQPLHKLRICTRGILQSAWMSNRTAFAGESQATLLARQIKSCNGLRANGVLM